MNGGVSEVHRDHYSQRYEQSLLKGHNRDGISLCVKWVHKLVAEHGLIWGGFMSEIIPTYKVVKQFRFKKETSSFVELIRQCRFE